MVLDNIFIQWIVGQTGLVGIAALALFMLRQAYEDREKIRNVQISESKTSAENERIRADKLITVLSEQIKAETELSEVLRGVKDVVGKCGLSQYYLERTREETQPYPRTVRTRTTDDPDSRLLGDT